MPRRNLQTQLRDLVRAKGVVRTADDANMEATKVSRWLNGIRPIRADELEQLARAVGYRLEMVPMHARTTGPEGDQ